MCDADNLWTLYHERLVTARKPHRCYSCDETIRVGDRYQLISGKWDGEFDSFRHCRRCVAMFEALYERQRIDPDPYFEGVALDLDCGEIWEDPPDDVAALAFALPSDFSRSA